MCVWKVVGVVGINNRKRVLQCRATHLKVQNSLSHEQTNQCSLLTYLCWRLGGGVVDPAVPLGGDKGGVHLVEVFVASVLHPAVLACAR